MQKRKLHGIMCSVFDVWGIPAMEYNGVMLYIGMYVTFQYDDKRMRGRIETLGKWGLRISYVWPHNGRVGYSSCNWKDKVTKEPKVLNLGVVG